VHCGEASPRTIDDYDAALCEVVGRLKKIQLARVIPCIGGNSGTMSAARLIGGKEIQSGASAHGHVFIDRIRDLEAQPSHSMTSQLILHNGVSIIGVGLAKSRSLWV
jgi:hypothetical protein